MDQPDQTCPEAPAPGGLVGVAFHHAGHIHDYDAGVLPLARGDRVVVETERGPALAVVETRPCGRRPATRVARVLRKADAHDLAREEENRDRERRARRVCLERIAAHDLPMKLVGVAYPLDGGKAVVYFYADGRVDFRALVRDLAQALRVRVEMKQIGARDETKLVGGLGPCGRELCCSTWLRECRTVSVKMAKEQGLSLTPSKLSGMCGRLKCCLRYEYATYLELRRDLPRVGSVVTSLKGDGEVLRHNVLRQTAVVRRHDDAVEVEVTLEDLVEHRAD